MADNVDWGILQSLQSSIPKGTATEAPQANGSTAPAPNVAGLLAAKEAAEANKAKLPGQVQGQQLQNQLAQQQLDTNQQLLPGRLQGQTLQNTGQGLLNQKSQMELSNAQYQLKMRQAYSQAYQEGETRGGPEAGFDAVQEKKAQFGDIEGALNLAKTRQALKDDVQAGNTKGIGAIGDTLFNLMKQVRPPTPAYKDPKTGNIVPADPGISSKELYTQQYPMIKKMWADAPNPSSYKDSGEFEDEMVHPILNTAGPIVQKQAADLKAQTESDQYKADQVVKSARADLQNAIKQDPNSQDTQDAAKALQDAQRNASRISLGGATGTLGTLQRIANAPASSSDLIKQNTPTPSAPQVPVVPDGRVAVYDSKGNLGHIPQEQLQDAVANGYTPIQPVASAPVQGTPTQAAPIVPGVTPGTMSITPSAVPASSSAASPSSASQSAPEEESDSGQ